MQILEGAEHLCRVTACYENFGKPYRGLLSIKYPFGPSESGFSSILQSRAARTCPQDNWTEPPEPLTLRVLGREVPQSPTV